LTRGGQLTGWYNLVIGHAGGTGSATVDGANSLLSSTNALYVGYDRYQGVGAAGNGTLALSNGGWATAPTVVIGGAGGTGSVSVGGTGSTLATTSLHIGQDPDINTAGTGTLNINPGGTVNVTNTLKVWNGA